MNRGMVQRFRKFLIATLRQLVPIVLDSTSTAVALTTVVLRVMALVAISAWRQSVIVVVQRHAPTTIRAAITSLAWFFAYVVHKCLLGHVSMNTANSKHSFEIVVLR
jgi:uncharacterized membrane protein YqjE